MIRSDDGTAFGVTLIVFGDNTWAASGLVKFVRPDEWSDLRFLDHVDFNPDWSARCGQCPTRFNLTSDQDGIAIMKHIHTSKKTLYIQKAHADRYHTEPPCPHWYLVSEGRNTLW